MVKAFPLFDSIMVALAAFALGACVAAYRSWGVTGYSILLIMAACLVVLVYRMGGKQGRGNVDGVFLSPLLRVSALLLIIISFGGWWSIPTRVVLSDDAETPMEVQVETFCSDRLRNLTQLLDAIEREGELTKVSKKYIAELRLKLGFCEGTVVDEAYDRSEKILERFSAPSTTPEDDDEQHLADGLAPDFIPQAPNAPSPPPPSTTITIPDDTEPRAGGEPRIPVTINVPGTSGETIIVEYKPSLFLKVLGFILFPIASIFGIDLTATEVQSAVLRAAYEQSGEPIEELLKSKQLDSAARNAVIDAIGSVVSLNQHIDPKWGEGWKYFLETDVPKALCLLALQKTGFTRGALELRLPDERKLIGGFLKLHDRKTAEGEIEMCIREKDESENGSALEYFRRLKRSGEQG